MFDLICVTNRRLCKDGFISRIDRISASLSGEVGAIILREKDLSPSEYESLARQVMDVCKKRNVACILHNFVDVALSLESEGLHVPLEKLLEMNEQSKRKFKYLGASCHSLDDIRLAQEAGCTYATLGHIFATDCKRGLPPKGTEFLLKACESVTIPVYAIGGINIENARQVMDAKASGVCVMSALMQCEDVEGYVKSLLKELRV